MHELINESVYSQYNKSPLVFLLLKLYIYYTFVITYVRIYKQQKRFCSYLAATFWRNFLQGILSDSELKLERTVRWAPLNTEFPFYTLDL